MTLWAWLRLLTRVQGHCPGIRPDLHDGQRRLAGAVEQQGARGATAATARPRGGSRWATVTGHHAWVHAGAGPDTQDAAAGHARRRHRHGQFAAEPEARADVPDAIGTAEPKQRGARRAATEPHQVRADAEQRSILSRRIRRRAQAGRQWSLSSGSCPTAHFLYVYRRDCTMHGRGGERTCWRTRGARASRIA